MAARKDMLKMGRAMAGLDRGRKPKLQKLVLLETYNVDRLPSRCEMERKINKGGLRIFNRCKALVELARCKKLVQKFFRHRFIGLIMPGKAAKNFPLLEPMLVKLRGKFDKI